MNDFKVSTIEVEQQIIAPTATPSVAGLLSTTDKTKLDGIQDGATANQSDAFLLNRANHTGTQLASTISDFSSAATSVINSLKGIANGIAPLDGAGLIPSTYLPSYVDDVLEFSSLAAFPLVGEQGKIYVAQDTNKQYRWSGSAYVQITSGAVDSVFGRTGIITAQSGDYNASQITFSPAGNISSLNVQLAIQELDSEKQPLDADLTAIAGLTLSGIVVKTGDGTAASRTITGTAGRITVANGNGISGNPTVDLDLSGVAAGSYGTQSQVPQFNVDQYGRITSSSNVNILIASSQVSDFAEAAQDSVGTILQDTASVDFTYNDVLNTISATVLPAGVNHNLLLNYISNEHVDHSSVNINAGTGLVGGGDITASRTISMPNVGTAGTYGSANQVPVLTTDAQGRVTTVVNTAITGVPAANIVNIPAGDISSTNVQSAINELDSEKARLAGGNVFTGDQYMGGIFTNITPAPLNMVNSAAGALRTQLNLVNTGGGSGAGSAIDFHTYDVAGGTLPGARVAAIDDNFSAYIAFSTKNAGAAANPLTERMRITNDGRVGVGATPVATAKLQVDSNTQGFLQPRMTTAERLAITSPANGLTVHDTTLNQPHYFDGTEWIPITKFGTYYFYASDIGESQTSSTAYQTKLTLTTPSLPTGTYRVGWSFSWQYSGGANDFVGGIFVNNNLAFEVFQEPQDTGTDQNHPAAGNFNLENFSGVATLEIRWRSSLLGIVARIRNARLEIWRVG